MSTPDSKFWFICLMCLAVVSCRSQRVLESTVSSSLQSYGLRQFDTRLELNDTILILHYQIDSTGVAWKPQEKIIRTTTKQQRSTEVDSCRAFNDNVSFTRKQVDRLPFQDNGVLYRFFLTVILLGALCFLIKRL